LFGSIVDFFAKDNMQTVFDNLTYSKLIYVGFAIVIFILFVLLKKIFAKYVFKIILRLVNKTKFNADTKIVSAFERPLINFFEVLGLYFAYIILMQKFTIRLDFINKVFSSSIILLISWGLYNLTGESSLLFEKMHKAYDIKVDKILFPFISKILRLILLALVITIIAEKWGYNIQGFITGLGLGGLAFALAAKDAAANIIAGILIILDKPFALGDWINNDSLEGTVEEITFRTTKIRTFDLALIIVPNSKLVSEPVTNYSRRGKRRLNFNLGLNYGTSRDKLEICVTKIRNLIENHAQVNKDEIYVRFDKFNASSLDIFIYFFVETAKLGEFLEIKENINFGIMDILQQEDVSLALPGTSVYVEKLPDMKKEDNKLEYSHNKKETSVQNNDN